jgi:hypothetical protein
VIPTCSPHQPTIERQVQDAYDDPGTSKDTRPDIRIDKLVQIMQQEPALIRGNPCFLFQPIFQKCQRARPHKFRKNSPNQRGNMQTAEKRTGVRHERTEDNPHDEDCMDEQYERCQRRIQGRRPRSQCSIRPNFAGVREFKQELKVFCRLFLAEAQDYFSAFASLANMLRVRDASMGNVEHRRLPLASR